MNRSSIKIGLVVLGYLAAGAVVNVVVAWGIAVWVHVPEKVQQFGRPRASEHWRVPETWPPLLYIAAGRDWGIISETAFYSDESAGSTAPPRIGISNLTGTGFPFITARWETWNEPGAVGPTRASVPEIRIPNVMRPAKMQGRMVRFPVTPCWGGLAANAAIFGGMAWGASIGVFGARRWLRLRRGHCPICGYSIGVSTICTECGRELPRWVVRARGDSTRAAAMKERSAEG